MGQTYDLGKGASVTLNAAGAGTVQIGPDSGPSTWNITGVIVQTNRPGQAPVPRVQVFNSNATPGNSQGVSYDGSFAQGDCDITLTRGQYLIAEWTGGKSGDVATITVTGKKW